MKRTYILLKDLPDVKAGAEFTISDGGTASIETPGGYTNYLYSKEFVESNTEWFALKVNVPMVFIGIKSPHVGNCSNNLDIIYVECEDGFFRTKSNNHKIKYTKNDMLSDLSKGYLKQLI